MPTVSLASVAPLELEADQHLLVHRPLSKPSNCQVRSTAACHRPDGSTAPTSST